MVFLFLGSSSASVESEGMSAGIVLEACLVRCLGFCFSAPPQSSQSASESDEDSVESAASSKSSQPPSFLAADASRGLDVSSLVF